MRSRLATLVRGSSRPDTVLRSRPAHLRVTVVVAAATVARPQQPHPPPRKQQLPTSPLTCASISDRLTRNSRDTGNHGRWAALRDELAGTGDAHAHFHPRKSSPATSTFIVLRPNARSKQPIWRRNSSASVRSVLPDNRSAPAARNCSRHFLSRLSAISCSRHSSAIVFGPRSDASTISVFCAAVNLRYFLVSLNTC